MIFEFFTPTVVIDASLIVEWTGIITPMFDVEVFENSVSYFCVDNMSWSFGYFSSYTDF